MFKPGLLIIQLTVEQVQLGRLLALPAAPRACGIRRFRRCTRRLGCSTPVNNAVVWCPAKRLVMMLAVGAATVMMPLALGPTAHATTIDCKHSGPVVNNPGMEHICYVHHDNGHTEIFYAPGPNARP
jgi:hypothetical protein